MKPFYDDSINWVFNFEAETTDHFLLSELFQGVEEYGVVVDRRDNNFCSFGIKLAKELKSDIKKLIPEVDILVKSQFGTYDIEHIKRARDNNISFTIATKMGLPVSLWCNTRNEILNPESPVLNASIVGMPITDTFHEQEKLALLSYTLPVFSDYSFMYRGNYTRTNEPASIQHGKIKSCDIVFLLLNKILNNDLTSYLSTIKSIRFPVNNPEYAFYVEWGIQQNPLYTISLHFGSRLRGSIYKAFTPYRFSVSFFKDEFTKQCKHIHEDTIEEIYARRE